ncbi:riboflavin kinase [Dacryopinax primogenitus]|uniref:Riboflavin kinase n=1 Tax=Dacryopinax primogenitus (strain DJM 731) TaxID=1858805 RepID=M5FRP9_DACPD|nr:riboflavin kinase [Dacryopinax primogenitus]EJT97679.1 riboflavin kinase [Dacryopinax primogenitus]
MAAEHHPHTEPLSTEQYRASRPNICGPDSGPEEPFPIVMYGLVQPGFGRGSKELGCPTANLPDDAIELMASKCQHGIYYGYARVHQPPHGKPGDLEETEIEVYPMVMSLGNNPYYNNEKMTAEVHVIHEFEHDFYGHEISVLVLGYIRPELDYTSRDALKEDIATDIRVTLNSVARPTYNKYREDAHWTRAQIR